MPVYTTSKAGVHGLTRSFARDLGQHRIRVNTVVPGWVMTERQKALWVTPEAMAKHMERQCLPDLSGPHGRLPGVGPCGHVHRQQLHGRGGIDLSG